MDDFISENNEILKQIYTDYDNYAVEGDNNPEKCIIYFSSNALYYPNTEESIRSCISHDRYEWKRFRSLNKDDKRVKEIFLRDVFKSWYLKGISKKYNSIEKTLALLRELIGSCSYVVTVGSSAGGYAAVLFGCLLNAKTVFAFSAQFDINDKTDTNLIVRKYRDVYSLKYYSLKKIISQSKTKVMYFYPSFVEQDLTQEIVVHDLDNVYKFRIKGNIHGMTIYRQCIPYTLDEKDNKLIGISRKFSGRTISPFVFSNEEVGCIAAFKHMIVDYAYKTYKYFGKK